MSATTTETTVVQDYRIKHPAKMVSVVNGGPKVRISPSIAESVHEDFIGYCFENKVKNRQDVIQDAISNHVRWGRQYAALAKAMNTTVPALIDELLKDCAEGKKAREKATEVMRANFKKGDATEGGNE